MHSSCSTHRDHRSFCDHRFAGASLLFTDSHRARKEALSDPEVQDDGGRGGGKARKGPGGQSRPQEGVRGEAEARERSPGDEGREVSPEDQPRRASPDLQRPSGRDEFCGAKTRHT